MISAVNNPPNESMCIPLLCYFGSCFQFYEELAFPLQKMESDRLFKQDQLNQVLFLLLLLCSLIYLLLFHFFLLTASNADGLIEKDFEGL